MYGHSLGGTTAAAAMLSDPRIRGGINFDGRLLGPALSAGLDKPFLLAGRPNHIEEDPTWDMFYSKLRHGALVEVGGTTHGSFTDVPTLIQSLNLTLPEELKSILQSQFGTLEFGRAGRVVAGIVSAFSDFVLEKKMGSMFTTGDDAYPEVAVLRGHL